jgi:hypothetical protein
MPGTAGPSETPAFSIGHSTVMHPTDANMKSWLGVVLYSHAPPTNPMPMYHNGDKIAGEVRMILEKPESLSSIDVWVRCCVTLSLENPLKISYSSS